MQENYSSLSSKQPYHNVGFPMAQLIILFLYIIGIIIAVSFIIKPLDIICMELDGAVFGPLQFERNHFSWWVSDDFGVGGTYECKSGEIIAHSDQYWNQPIVGKFIPPDRLTWNGGEYVRTPGKAQIPAIALSRQRILLACILIAVLLISAILITRRHVFGW